MTAEGLPVQRSCALLGVSESGYYAWRNRVPSKRQIRHAWVLDQVQAVHEATRVWAELTEGSGLRVGQSHIELVMSCAGLQGIPGERCRR